MFKKLRWLTKGIALTMTLATLLAGVVIQVKMLVVTQLPGGSLRQMAKEHFTIRMMRIQVCNG